MDMIDLLEQFREALLEKKKEEELRDKAIQRLHEEFQYLRENGGRFQYTVKELSDIYKEHPNTIRARIRKHQIKPVGKRGQSYTYLIKELEEALLLKKYSEKPRHSRQPDYFARYRNRA